LADRIQGLELLTWSSEAIEGLVIDSKSFLYLRASLIKTATRYLPDLPVANPLPDGARELVGVRRSCAASLHFIPPALSPKRGEGEGCSLATTATGQRIGDARRSSKIFQIFYRPNSFPRNDLQPEIRNPPRFFLKLGHPFC
jgi:hypothetical protein